MSKVFFSVRRLQRSEDAKRGRYGLNLVPLMDVFTILVFFFLVHSTEVAPTGNTSNVTLPESIAESLPRQTPVVTLTADEVLFQDKPLVSVQGLMESSAGEISLLEQALVEWIEAAAEQAEFAAGGRELTIMADKGIPFRLLRKVMLSCNRAGFQHIALSVLQRSSLSSPLPGAVPDTGHAR